MAVGLNLTCVCCIYSGSTRSSATWREADLEWLGLKPEEVQTSVFEMGREQPNAQEYQTAGVS